MTRSTESKAAASTSTPRTAAIAFAVVDLAWAALGLTTTGLLVVLAVTLSVAVGLDPSLRVFVLDGVRDAWARAPLACIAMVAEIALGALGNVALLFAALRLLRGRIGAVGLLRAWAAIACVLSVCDLAWILAGWIDPWSWILVPFVLVTPCWAVANVLVVREDGRTTPLAVEPRPSTVIG